MSQRLSKTRQEIYERIEERKSDLQRKIDEIARELDEFDRHLHALEVQFQRYSEGSFEPLPGASKWNEQQLTRLHLHEDIARMRRRRDRLREKRDDATEEIAELERFQRRVRQWNREEMADLRQRIDYWDGL